MKDGCVYPAIVRSNSISAKASHMELTPDKLADVLLIGGEAAASENILLYCAVVGKIAFVGALTNQLAPRAKERHRQ